MACRPITARRSISPEMTPALPLSPSQTTRRFAPATALARLDAHQDEDGFLQPSPYFFGADRLLERACSLVVAPPWFGKSFTAQQIEKTLSPGPEAQPAFSSRYLKRTDLEQFMSGQPLAPPWWPEWRDSDHKATWIIDSLEEGQRRDAGLCPSLIQLLEELSPDRRQRLRLVAFAREGDLRQVYPELEGKLRAIFGEDFLVADLLPLGVDNARDLLRQSGGDDAGWERVLGLIRRNHLQRLAGYPAVLSFLSRQRASATLSVSDVWEGVLQKLLEELHYHSQSTPFHAELERRFAASARIAAVLTLSGHEELVEEQGLASSIAGPRPTLSQVIPVPEPPHQKATQAAAAEALRSAMFRPTGEGHRFLHRNVRDWMAAFGMSRLRLAQLRPVLQATPGALGVPASIRPELSDLARLLIEVHEVREVRDWIQGTLKPLPSDLFLSSIVEVRGILDRLEQLAARGARLDWLDDPADLRTLLVAGLGQELALRLLYADKPTPARIMLLRIGAELALEEVLTAAAAILRDGSQDHELRSWCSALLGRSAGIDLLRSLESWVATSGTETRAAIAIASSLISGFVRARLWTAARAFQWLPQTADDDVTDATQVLSLALAGYITLDDAEIIVESLAPAEIEELDRAVGTPSGQERWSPPPRWRPYAAAVRKLALQAAEPATIGRLLPVALNLSDRNRGQVPALERFFRASDVARRGLFKAALEAQRAAETPRDHLWRWIHTLLIGDDLEWLVGHLDTLAEGMPLVCHIALRLAEQRPDSDLKRRVQGQVQQQSPEAFAAYQQYRAEESEREKRKQETQPPVQKRPIEEVNRELVASSTLDERQLLWRLSRVNFSDDTFVPGTLAGRWPDVSPPVQDEVLNACAAALDIITPTPVPEGTTVPNVLQYEAQAFVALVRFRPERFDLTEARILRWLPAVLKTFHAEKFGILEACLRAVPAASEDVLLEAVERELRNESAYSILLQDLPAPLWTDRVARWVADAIAGSQPAEARPALLEFLAARRPEKALPIARSLLAGRPMARVLGVGDGSAPDLLALRALEVLLAQAPGEAWPLIKEGAALQGKVFLEHLRGFGPGVRDSLTVAWQKWPLERIADLARVLFAVYPPEEDPPEIEGGFLVTPAFELRQLRGRLLQHLVQSPLPEAPAVADSAKQIHPLARQFIERRQASLAAGALLSQSTPASPGLAVVDARRLLDDEHFRLIRSSDDLLEVVVEELGKLEHDVGYDHAMLYCPGTEGAADKRRREKALQAYVLRRLKDRLLEKVLDRETEVKRGRRLDIRVIAPRAYSQEVATTVIEVKWSDNSGSKRGVSTALTEQLGKEYLLAEELHHGVYLVAWTGKLGPWQSSVGTPPSDIAALREALRKQADQFRREHNHIDIRPLVWDVQQAPPPAPTRRRRQQSAAVR
jgi:hypothetical protein